MEFDYESPSTPDTLTLPDLASATLALTLTSGHSDCERRSRSREPDLDSNETKRLKRTVPTSEHQDEQEARGRKKERRKQDLREADGSAVALMGFGGIGSTKYVSASKGGQGKLLKKSEVGQYLNRAQAFSRPLSPSRKV